MYFNCLEMNIAKHFGESEPKLKLQLKLDKSQFYLGGYKPNSLNRNYRNVTIKFLNNVASQTGKRQEMNLALSGSFLVFIFEITVGILSILYAKLKLSFIMG